MRKSHPVRGGFYVAFGKKMDTVREAQGFFFAGKLSARRHTFVCRRSKRFSAEEKTKPTQRGKSGFFILYLQFIP